METARFRKALVAGAGAGLASFGTGWGTGSDWRAALGTAAAAALLVGYATYRVPNQLSSAELLKLAELAAEQERLSSADLLAVAERAARLERSREPPPPAGDTSRPDPAG